MNKNKYGRCLCSYVMYGEEKDIIVHLSDCPVADIEMYINYEKLPWYKKIFTKSPRDLYLELTCIK